MIEEVQLRETEVERHERKRNEKIFLVILIVLAAVGSYFFWKYVPDAPVDYADINDHFKYGSIGSEPANGPPYWIWKVLPDMFPEKLPVQGKGYEGFGLIQEPGTRYADRVFGPPGDDRPGRNELRDVPYRDRKRYAAEPAAHYPRGWARTSSICRATRVSCLPAQKTRALPRTMLSWPSNSTKSSARWIN